MAIDLPAPYGTPDRPDAGAEVGSAWIGQAANIETSKNDDPRTVRLRQEICVS